EKTFRYIGASAFEAVRLLVIDPQHFVLGVEIVPRAGFVGMNDGAIRDALADEIERCRFAGEHAGESATAALAHDHHDLTLRRLVRIPATVLPIRAPVLRFDVPAKIRAVDFRDRASAAERTVRHVRRHRLAHLVRQNERGFVLDAKIAAKGQHALALYLVAEDRDGGEIHLEWQLVRREQRPGRNRVVGAAILAPPARRTMRAAAIVGRQAPALGADRRAVRLGPTYLTE